MCEGISPDEANDRLQVFQVGTYKFLKLTKLLV